MTAIKQGKTTDTVLSVLGEPVSAEILPMLWKIPQKAADLS